MKIRTQDARKYLEFGESYTTHVRNGYFGVYISNQYHPESILAGVYGDEARAKGVLYEIGLAHQTGERIFYMPAE